MTAAGATAQPAAGTEVADDDLERVSAYTRYVIDCPSCEAVIELEEDPAGTKVECDVCDTRVWVESTR